MANMQFGFIGTGNMGGALALAVAKSQDRNEIILADKMANKAQMLANNIGCVYGDNRTVAQNAKFIFLGVKPQMLKSTVNEIAYILANRTDRFVIVSMAAGVKISALNDMFGNNYPIIRIMPNTPASVGKGMILYTCSDDVFMDEIGEFCDAMRSAGRIDKIDESLIDAASAVSGCGPAFVYLFAEAMADAGVECGLPRAKAIEYAAQTIAGAAAMLLDTGKHPGQLKDDVCSPGGSTIAGVHSLEDAAFRSAVMNAVKSAYLKTLDLGK